MITCCREETRFALLTRSLVEDENRRDGHQIKAKEGVYQSVESSTTKEALCAHIWVSIHHMCFQCVFISQGSSVCVHVVVDCLSGSSQRGWHVRFWGAFLVSALIEEHVGCFSLQQDYRVRVTLPQSNDEDTWHCRQKAEKAKESSLWWIKQ